MVRFFCRWAFVWMTTCCVGTSLLKAGDTGFKAKVQYTEYAGVGHNSDKPYANDKVPDRLVAQKLDDGIIRPSNTPNAVQQQMIARRYGMFIHFSGVRICYAHLQGTECMYVLCQREIP